MADWRDSELYNALKANNQELVLNIMNNNPSAGSQLSASGETYLHAAVDHQCDKSIVEQLLPHVPLAQRDEQGKTAFQHALEKNTKLAGAMSEYVLGLILAGNIERIQELAMGGWDAWPLKGIKELDEDPKLMLYLHGSTHNMPSLTRCLHQSVMSDDSQEVLDFIEQGAETAGKDAAGLTALHKAVIYENEDCMQVVQRGALNVTDNLGRTALHYAASLDDDSMFGMLKGLGEDPTLKDKLGKSPADYMTDKSSMNLAGVIGFTELLFMLPHLQNLLSDIHQHIVEGNLAGIKEALDRKRYVTLRDASGLPPIHKAVIYSRKDIVKYMLENFKDAATVTDHWGRQPIHYAFHITEHKEDILDLLHAAGAKDQTHDSRGVSPGSSDIDIEKMQENAEFLSKVSDFQVKVSAAHAAVQDNDLTTLKELVDRKALLLAKDGAGMTLLHKAVLLQHEDMVKYLVDNYPKALDATDNLGRTALHLAVAASYDNIKRDLEKAGAKSTQDLSGNTPDYYSKNPREIDLLALQQRAEGKARVATVMPPPKTPAAAASQRRTTPQREHTQTMDSSTRAPGAAAGDQPQSKPEPEPKSRQIKEDPFAFKNVAYPETPEANFLARVLGAALARGLGEVAERRPNDPIEYLAHYLYCYRDNLVYYENQAELGARLSAEMEDFEREQARQARLREEAQANKERAKELEKQQKESDNQIREEDERKLRDSLIRPRPELPTLAEDEEEEQLRARDEWGQTQLHLLAGKEGSELNALLQQGYNIADRDLNGKTPRDHAKDSEIKENMELIDEFVIELFHNSKSTEIYQLVMNGYLDQFPDLSNIQPQLSEDMTELLQSLPDIQDRVNGMFESVESGSLANVKQSLDRKAMAYAKNIKGQSPLHVAVLKNYLEIVQYMLEQYPGTVHCKDNLSRQPLHYAYAVSEELATLLIDNKADKDAEDAKKKLPNQYAGQLAEIEA